MKGLLFLPQTVNTYELQKLIKYINYIIYKYKLGLDDNWLQHFIIKLPGRTKLLCE